MTDDRGTVAHSVGPYRLTSAEFISIAWATRSGLFQKTYNCIASALVTMALQLSLWGVFLLAYRLAIGPAPVAVLVGAVAFAGLMAILLMFWVIGAALMRSYFKRQMIARFDYTINLYDDRMQYALGKVSASLPWEAIDRIVDKRGCVFFFLDDLAAIIVPRRAFASTANADAFLSFAQARWRAARA
jgi:hypothetical protein